MSLYRVLLLPVLLASVCLLGGCGDGSKAEGFIAEIDEIGDDPVALNDYAKKISYETDEDTGAIKYIVRGLDQENPRHMVFLGMFAKHADRPRQIIALNDVLPEVDPTKAGLDEWVQASKETAEAVNVDADDFDRKSERVLRTIADQVSACVARRHMKWWIEDHPGSPLLPIAKLLASNPERLLTFTIDGPDTLRNVAPGAAADVESGKGGDFRDLNRLFRGGVVDGVNAWFPDVYPVGGLVIRSRKKGGSEDIKVEFKYSAITTFSTYGSELSGSRGYSKQSRGLILNINLVFKFKDEVLLEIHDLKVETPAEFDYVNLMGGLDLVGPDSGTIARETAQQIGKDVQAKYSR